MTRAPGIGVTCHRPSPSLVPGVFIRAAPTRLSRSWSGTNASIAFDDHASSNNAAAIVGRSYVPATGDSQQEVPASVGDGE